MSDDFGFQLFWMILMLTVFCMFLVGGGVFAKYASRKEYKHFLKLQAAREAWAKMLTGGSNDRT